MLHSLWIMRVKQIHRQEQGLKHYRGAYKHFLLYCMVASYTALIFGVAGADNIKSAEAYEREYFAWSVN